MPDLLQEDAYDNATRLYPGHQIEMDHAGNIKVAPLSGPEGGGREAEAIIQLGIWNKQTQVGKVFSSQTVFRLPNGAKLLPDVAWMPADQWTHTDEQTSKTYRGVLVPAFVIEVRSQTDNLSELEDKCREWIAGGVQEAWLIDPLTRKMQIFRPNSAIEVMAGEVANGPSFMPGFVLNLQPIWDD